MEEKETGENLSTQKRLSGQDPGWNDPPKWAFTANQTSSTTPGKRTLNKRVPFPLSSKDNASKQPLPELSPKLGNMPPALDASLNLTTAPHPPLMLPSDTDKGTNISNERVHIDKTEALNEALINLQIVIERDIAEKNRVEEIKKRIHVMKAAWEEDKLNNQIQLKILELSKALINNEVQKADQVHLQLVMQYANLCNPWIPGIRHLILALKAKENSSTAQVQESQPCLLPVAVKETK